MAKLTVKELIKQKEILKQKKDKQADIYVQSIDREITVKCPTNSVILEAASFGEQDPTKADKYLIMECTIVPNLRDRELQEAYECVDPTDIVDHIFEPGEIPNIAMEIMALAGYKNTVKKVVDDIKN